MICLPNAQDAHLKFLRAREAQKRLFAFSSGIAALAIILGLGKLVAELDWEWAPFIVLVLTIAAAALRSFGRFLGGYAQECRRLAVRALAFERDLDPARIGKIRAEEPLLSRIAGRVVSPALVQYYDPVGPAGHSRLRQLYGHSAFFTWRLSSLYVLMLWILLFLAAVLVLASLYSLATTSPPDVPKRIAAVDVLYSVLMVYLTVSAINALALVGSTAQRAKEITVNLLDSGALPDETIEEIALGYDILRENGAEIPTWIYRLSRRRITDDWNERKKALGLCDLPPNVPPRIF